MKRNRKNIRIIILIILSLNMITIPILMGFLFPNNGGFTRNVIFIHPTSHSDGYFVIVDEIHTSKPISFMFHSRGSLEVGLSSSIWTQNEIQMNCSFFGSEVQITPKRNYLYAGSNKEEHDYIQVQPTLGSKHLITIIHFRNTTLGNSIELNQSISNSILTIEINSTDTFVLKNDFSEKRTDVWEYNAYQTDGNFFLVRQSGQIDQNFLLSSSSTYFLEGNTQWHNGDLKPFVVSNDTSYSEYYSGVYSEIEYSTPLNHYNFSSPGLYFSDDELPELRERINTVDSQWETWYNYLDSKSPLSKAFQGRIEQEPISISQCEEQLLDLELYYETELKGTQDIEISTALTEFILAYDMIHLNVSSPNQDTIENAIFKAVEPIYQNLLHDVQYRNNHVVVSSVAVGLAGLLLKIPEWIEEAQSNIDFYLNGDGIRPNGACYEGAHYAYFEFKHASKFFYALQLVGGYNYFSNPRYQAFLNYTVNSMAPTGESPVFEDCQVNQSLNIIASLAMSNVHDTNPTLAENLKYYFDRSSPFTFEYVSQIVLNHNGNISATQPNIGNINQGFIFPSDGYACFRSGWETHDFYLVLSNKNFLQSHVHQDENSLELYAYGKKWMTNPGYPSWGWEGHSYSINAEASNTAVINGRGQFSHLGDGFLSGVQHELVDYVESPTKITYSHPANLWKWSGSLIMYIIFVLFLIGFTFLEFRKPLRFLPISQTKMIPYFNYIHGINTSLGIWLIAIPLFNKLREFLSAHVALSPQFLIFSSISGVLLSLGGPFAVFTWQFSKRKMDYLTNIQEIFFRLFLNIGIGMIISPILILTLDKMIFESGSTLIVAYRWVNGVSVVIPILVGIVIIKFIGDILKQLIRKSSEELNFIKKWILAQAWIWLIFLYILIAAIAILYSIGSDYTTIL